MSTKQEQTALAFISALSALDSSAFNSLCTPDCPYQFLPASMSIPTTSISAFATQLSGLSLVLRSFPVTPREVMSDGQRNKVIIHATSVAEFKEEIMDGREGDSEEWKYNGEYVFIFEFAGEDEGKISKVVEFVDSKETEKLMGLMGRAMGNRAKREAEGPST